MKILDYFKEWLSHNEEKKKFYDMWENEWSEELTETNACNSYHKKVAYEIFLLEKRIEDLEKRII